MTQHLGQTFSALIDVSENATTSNAVNLGNHTLTRIDTPAALTGTTITFQVCSTLGGTYVPLENGTGTSLSKTVSASKGISITPQEAASIGQFFKIVSGSTESADRTFIINARQMG